MFTYLALIISLRLAFGAYSHTRTKLRTIERDEEGGIKTKDPSAKGYTKILQKTLAFIEHLIKENKTQSLQKKQLKKKKFSLGEAKAKAIDDRSHTKDGISYIAHLLNKYKEFIKQDLTLLIKEANSYLRSLKQKIINDKDYDTRLCNAEFQEITQIYHSSEVMIEKCTANFYGYQKMILEQGALNPRHKAIQSKLNHVIKELDHGHKMLDLSKNRDYCFVENYLKEKSEDIHFKSPT